MLKTSEQLSFNKLPDEVLLKILPELSATDVYNMMAVGVDFGGSIPVVTDDKNAISKKERVYSFEEFYGNRSIFEPSPILNFIITNFHHLDKDKFSEETGPLKKIVVISGFGYINLKIKYEEGKFLSRSLASVSNDNFNSFFRLERFENTHFLFKDLPILSSDGLHATTSSFENIGTLYHKPKDSTQLTGHGTDFFQGVRSLVLRFATQDIIAGLGLEKSSLERAVLRTIRCNIEFKNMSLTSLKFLELFGISFVQDIELPNVTELLLKLDNGSTKPASFSNIKAPKLEILVIESSKDVIVSNIQTGDNMKLMKLEDPTAVSSKVIARSPNQLPSISSTTLSELLSKSQSVLIEGHFTELLGYLANFEQSKLKELRIKDLNNYFNPYDYSNLSLPSVETLELDKYYSPSQKQEPEYDDDIVVLPNLRAPKLRSLKVNSTNRENRHVRLLMESIPKQTEELYLSQLICVSQVDPSISCGTVEYSLEKLRVIEIKEVSFKALPAIRNHKLSDVSCLEIVSQSTRLSTRINQTFGTEICVYNK